MRAVIFNNGAMLDIRLIREKTDFVRQRLALRNAGDEKKIDELLALDERRRKALVEVEQLQGDAQPRLQGDRRANGAKEDRRSRGQKSRDARLWAIRLLCLTKKARKRRRSGTR